MVNAGVEWTDEACVVDGNLISARTPDDLGPWSKALLAALHGLGADGMRIALDATPLLGQPTGVGRYVAGLVDGLTRLPEPPELTLERLHLARSEGRAGPARCPGHRPPRPGPAPSAGLGGVDFPPVEWLTGDADVVHGTDFVLPPRRAPSASSPCTTSPTCTTSPRSRRRPSAISGSSPARWNAAR